MRKADLKLLIVGKLIDDDRMEENVRELYLSQGEDFEVKRMEYELKLKELEIQKQREHQEYEIQLKKLQMEEKLKLKGLELKSDSTPKFDPTRCI